MGSLRYVRCVAAISICSFSFLAACGGKKPAGSSPFPARISLNPGVSASMQVGSTLVFSASAQNASNANLNTTFTYAVAPNSTPGVLDVSPTGFACAGSWNAPYYNVCTPAGTGVVGVIASALGATSAPTMVFVHPPVDNVQISLVPPVNSPPPACPNQVALPAACEISFNSAAANYCVSANQVQTLQATAYSKGVDVTSLVGPFTWSQNNLNVVKITPVINSSTNVVTNQATVQSSTPGATQVVASIPGISSQPYLAETCPVQCIALSVSNNGSQNPGQTSFLTNKGTSETIVATAVDVQGCIVPRPALTWTSSSPAAVTAGTGTTGCNAAATCGISTTQPGAAAITASCTPPTCNVGFPLNAPSLPSLYLPEAVYPATAITGLATGASIATSVLATSQDCYSNALCPVALYDISTTTNLASSPSTLPTPPNSLLIDAAGDRAYVGSQYGGVLVTVANIGSSSTNPFTSLPAPGTTLGIVTGKIIGVSPNGGLAVFSDTVLTPNQVYVVNSSSGTPSTTALNINSATTATFSPDNSKAFILGNGGNTLYVYSPLQALQTYNLTAPADAIAFSSTGSFAFIAGGDAASNVTVRNTCDNSLAVATAPAIGNFSITGLPATPLFLKMVPPANVPLGSALIPILQQDILQQNATALDFFYGVDSSGIDVIATSTTTPVNPQPSTLCAQQTIGLPQYIDPTTQLLTSFSAKHITLGTFHPINFFISPDSTQVYIVTSDLGILIYSFSSQTTTTIPLIGNAAPVAADMTADGTFLYVAGTDGLLHEINLGLALDTTPPIFFSQLPNSSNNFCYMNYSCTLNLVAVKP